MFNSRNPVYRDPVGAVAEGTRVHFKITMPRDLRCSAARLTVLNDSTGREQTLGMFWCGMNGDCYEWWECHFTPEQPGLYFYSFSVDTWHGTQKITRGSDSEGVLGNGGRVWQLTVYNRSFQTPDWLAGGVMYQIFPDRFYCSGQPKSGVPQDRRLHQDWYEQPDWKPDENGEITNQDYFGGDLKGIEEKLGYLKSLGVTCIYLNPIFEAHSNHRYNTADYSRVDPLLGTRADFESLCKAAKALGIHILLDGVFSHTGSDSVYFNREGRYSSEGAYHSQTSPYYSWYTFHQWPNSYDCWWNFSTLPNVNELNPSYNEYINGRNGIIQSWLSSGASGWRLDVADELPDGFLDNLRAAAKERDPDAVILGEVWEDASNKTAYGVRRKYLLGSQLDSVMNYPFRDAILGYLTGQNASECLEKILDILENYPPQVTRILMNHIGTHDTVRALTFLAGEPLRGKDRKWQSEQRLSPEQRKEGLRLMRLASLMQFTLPGVPCIYYGDEAGMEGYRDPFNRGCYPWGREERDLVEWYRMLGRMRSEYSVLKDGAFVPVYGDICMAYERRNDLEALLCAFNPTRESRSIQLESRWCGAHAVIGSLPEKSGLLRLEPQSCAALFLKTEKAPQS